MRTLIIFVFFFLVSNSTALADWIQEFETNYKTKGTDHAVVTALAIGADPYQIVKVALPLDGLSKENLVKALFCAIAQPDTVRDAAVTNGISEATVDDGYQLALAECSRQMDENLNAALDSSQRYPGNTSSSRESRRNNYASPWKFQ